MDAIAVIDKPAGLTSAEVVRRIKRLVRPARVGHLGTLDPFATGVLPILIGQATKLAPFLEGGAKRYRGVIELGAETDTLDREGAVVRTAPVPALNRARLAPLERQFTGKISQVPPVFSAIKREGVPLYRLARRGVAVAPPSPREVEIRGLQLEPAGDRCLRMEVVCGPGTYLRSLARDIAAALGSAGHLRDLRRLESGDFSLADAVALDDFLAALESGRGESLRMTALKDALPQLPQVKLDRSREQRLRQGDSSALDLLVPAAAGRFRVLSADTRLIAVARATSRTTAVIERIFNEVADA
jgi:tRNA pseudouridine55 synthase